VSRGLPTIHETGILLTLSSKKFPQQRGGIPSPRFDRVGFSTPHSKMRPCTRSPKELMVCLVTTLS